MRLLLFNLAVDAGDPVLGFTSVWINALARHCAQIDVLTMRAGRLALAENVRVFSVGREKGYSEARRALEFYRLLFGLLRQNRYDACFAHMQPLFAVMGWPLLRLFGVPVTLWYAHKSVTLRLRLAEKLVDHVVTASPESFRVASRKVIVVGHGIDTDMFSPDHDSGDRLFTVVSVSRIAPIKRLEVLIEAARLLKIDGFSFQLRIVGEAESAAYLRDLRDQVERHSLSDCVEFAGALPYHGVPNVYRQADVMVNLSGTGSVDKAVLEAMACELPVITANQAFTSILRQRDLLVPPDAPNILAQRIKAFAAMPPDQRCAIGVQLRQIVVEQHSLERLVQTLVPILSNPA